MKLDRKNKRIYIIMATVSFLLLVAVGIQLFMLHWFNQKNMENTSLLLLDRIVGVIERNEQNEKNLVDSLKEDYIVRAKTVSYIIDAKPEAEWDVAELKKIAGLVAVDEVHLFNPKGQIYSGTIPKYYGYTFHSGTQMKYFQPMLEDRTLSMCQSMTPNTAEQKEMMYAMVWNEAGTRMVQVGIQPFRLMRELKQNEISQVVSRMPTYAGMQIFVAEAATGKIYGATDLAKIGKTLDEIGVIQKETSGELQKGIVHVDGEACQASFVFSGIYTIGVVWSITTMEAQHTKAAVLIALYLGCAMVIILYMLMKVLKTREERNAQFSILVSMSKIYNSMHLIDLEKDTYRDYSFYTTLSHRKKVMADATDKLYQFMKKQTIPEDWNKVQQAIDLTTIAARMARKRIVSFDYMSTAGRWYRGSFISIGHTDEGRLSTLIFTTQDIDEEKRREENLLYASHTDILTQCRNRRAYMEDIHNFRDFLHDHDFLYVAMDVNGLKEVNDGLGHDAGDELLRGAAACMQQCFGSYGKVYRIGGDEFVAILLIEPYQIEGIQKDFADTVSKWKGKVVPHLTVSCGYVYSTEKEWTSVEEIAKEGDRRMYKEKNRYYEERGYAR